jgi:large subunit ribosomal protein L4
MDITVYNMAGERVDQVTLDEATLGGEPNFDLIRQAIVTYEANKRVGTVKAQRIDEVRRTSAKPWRQKHTGRARQGDRRSPIWVGGGVAHGPLPRDYRKKMNKNMRRRALQSAFLAKAADGEVLVVDDIELQDKKTREVAAMLKNLGVERSFAIVLPEYDSELWRCTRNIPGAAMTRASDLNAYSMIRPRQVVFTRAGLDAFLSANTRQKTEVSNG